MINGIDVSHYQDRTPALGGLDFLIARATYGTRRDDRFATHIVAAKQAGLVTGAYHFGRHGTVAAGSVAAQVDAFLAAVAGVGGVDLLVLDLEADGPASSMTDDEARLFLATVASSSGRRIGLYHSTALYPDLGQAWRWVADYRAKYAVSGPPIPWDIWQSRGSPLDLDRFRGTRADLIALGGQEDPMYELKFERWRRADGALITTVGAPRRPDGTVDYTSRLAVLSDHDGVNRRLESVARSTLSPVSGALNDPFYAALTGYALPDEASIRAAQLEADRTAVLEAVGRALP